MEKTTPSTYQLNFFKNSNYHSKSTFKSNSHTKSTRKTTRKTGWYIHRHPRRKRTPSPLFRAVATQQANMFLNPNLRQYLKDWNILTKTIASRSTSVLELVERYPHFMAYVDSSKFSVGSVWVNGIKNITPTV